MNRNEFEMFLGKEVRIVLFDGDILEGELHKTGEETFNNNPDLTIPKNYYFVTNGKVPRSVLFKVSHVTKIGRR